MSRRLVRLLAACLLVLSLPLHAPASAARMPIAAVATAACGGDPHASTGYHATRQHRDGFGSAACVTACNSVAYVAPTRASHALPGAAPVEFFPGRAVTSQGAGPPTDPFPPKPSRKSSLGTALRI